MQQISRKKPFFREEAKKRYRQKKNIETKWLDQYGDVTGENDYQRNRICLLEVFNMLDIVMEICIEDFRHSHTILSIGFDGKTPVYTFALDSGDTVTFSMPGSFARRVKVLRMIGYDLSDELFFDTRFLRNETAHGNQTIILENKGMNYEETMKAMRAMGQALAELGMLPRELLAPTFEMLRIREGDTLLGGAYVVQELLGEGGMARVYAALHRRSGRVFAVKEMKPGILSGERFKQECRILSGLHHERIPQYFDAFSENGTYYIVMQKIDGVPLERCVPERKLSDAAKRQIAGEITDVLSYLHSPDAGVVYADLSPDNCLADGENRVYLIDFGTAALMGERQIAAAKTPGYSAPEIAAGEPLDRRTDIYALGCMLWFLFTGTSPAGIERKSGQEIAEALGAHYRPGSREAGHSGENDPGAVQKLAEVIRICTEENPDHRFQTAEEVRQALDLAPFSEKDRAEDRTMDHAMVRDGKPVFSGLMRKSAGNRARAGAAAAALFLFVAAGVLWYRAGVRAGADRVAQNAAGSSYSMTSEAAEAETGQTESLQTESAQAVTAYAPVPEDHVMDWSDPALEQEMRRITGIDEGEIRLSDVSGLTELSLANCGISDISALGELKNLRCLNLNANRIGDITALSELTGLQVLLLNGNRIADAGPLSSLTQLTELDVGGNRIRTLGFIRNMDKLARLSLDSNELEEETVRSALEGRTLVSLNLSGLGLTDCSWLSGSRQQTEKEQNGEQAQNREKTQKTGQVYPEALYLSRNNIRDISPLAGLTGLRKLYLADNDIEDITALASLDSLEELDLQHNPIGDLMPLKDLTGLSRLDVKDCGLTDLRPVAGMKKLASVDASDNVISDLSPLSGLDRLIYLDLNSNALSGDLGALGGLEGLNYLDVRNNQISDISALKALTALRRLYLTGNPIEDITCLRGLALEELAAD